VRGFLETLPEEERKAYPLTETINDLETSNSIETFFIERAKQLLRADGVAAIILPSSILSNGGSAYIRTREILIQYFDIVAIAEFGSGTFGKTGTNTVTLFLRRKKTAPDTAAHYRERVEEWFKGCDASKRKQVIYKDEHLIARYAAHINVPLEDYKTLLKGDPNGAWTAHLEAVYLEKFNSSTEVANLYKAKWFKVLKPAEQDSEVEKRYLAFVQAIERDKLYHFVMACDQPNPVLIIRSPTENKAIKQFLGYEWSSAKGDEGIKLIKDAHGRHLTPLYDETNRDNATKLNYSIAANFNGTLAAIPSALLDVARTAPLVEMLDFSRAVFEKQINLANKGGAKIVSKWPISPLSSVAEIRKGTSITQKKAIPGGYKVIAGGMTHAYTHNAFNRPANTITVSASGASAGYVAFWKEPIFASDCTTVRGADDGHTEYLFHVLKSRQAEIQAASSGAAQPHVYPKDLEALQIPQPDPTTLKKIVSECRSIDEEVQSSRDGLENALARIDAEVANIYGSSAAHSEIAKIAIDIQYGLNEAMNEGGVGYKIFRMNEIIRGRMVDNGSMKRADISAEEFAKYKLNKGDLLFIRSNGSLEHIGKVGLFDLDGDYCYASYLVRIVPDSSKVLPRYLGCIMNSEVFRKGMVSLAVKSGGTNNINATKMKGIKVPVLSLADQKKFITKIEALEKQIADAQEVIDGAAARKQAILQKYL
jgi:restriction endonuclease S subunit